MPNEVTVGTTPPPGRFSARDANRVQLRRLELQYGQRRDLSEAERKMLYAEYLDAFHGYAPDRVEKAVTKYIRTVGNKFFPKVSELLELLPRPRAIYAPPKLAAIEGPRCTPEQAEEIRRLAVRMKA